MLRSTASASAPTTKRPSGPVWTSGRGFPAGADADFVALAGVPAEPRDHIVRHEGDTVVWMAPGYEFWLGDTTHEDVCSRYLLDSHRAQCIRNIPCFILLPFVSILLAAAILLFAVRLLDQFPQHYACSRPVSHL